MNTFGKIKTKIEEASVSVYGKPEFKSFIGQLKLMVLENKDISELYYIYDDLSTEKSLPKDISDDYINESVEYCQVLIEENGRKLESIDKWVSKYVKESKNDYNDIDNLIYSNSIKNLESVLESKRKIKNLLISESKNELKESLNLPISTMVKIGNSTLNKEFSNISENDKKELNSIVSLSKEDIINEINSLKEEVNSKLKSNLNESKDGDLSDAIQNTINKVNDVKYDHYNLYKLRKLNMGL